MIYISHLTLKNFRRLSDVSIPLKPKCVIIGENNAGKTSVLELLDIALNPTRRGLFLSDDDISHGSPSNARIEATIEISPMTGPVFGTAERAAFDVDRQR